MSVSYVAQRAVEVTVVMSTHVLLIPVYLQAALLMYVVGTQREPLYVLLMAAAQMYVELTYALLTVARLRFAVLI